MLTVTDRAVHFLRESLTHRREGMPEALRIVYTKQGYRLTLDRAKDGDHVFEYEGENYLLLDPEVGEALSDATLDAHESPQGMSITLTASRTPESESKSEAEAEAEAEAEGEPEPESEAEATSEADAEAEPEPESEPEQEPEPKPAAEKEKKAKA